MKGTCTCGKQRTLSLVNYHLSRLRIYRCPLGVCILLMRNVFLSRSPREALVFSKPYALHTVANAANLLQLELLVLAATSLQYLLEASKWTANSVFGVAGFVLPLHGMYRAYCSTG